MLVPSLLLISASSSRTTGSLALGDNETTRYFNQTFDHFNAETKSGTWKQRYYVNATFFKRSNHTPLFFIPGGEWSVGPTKGVLYGMAHELAEQHGGLMAIAEHRFHLDGTCNFRKAQVLLCADRRCDHHSSPAQC